MHRKRDLIFRIFYSTTFTIILLILLAHILVAPADAVYQAYKRKRLVNIFIIAGVYFLTAVITIVLYASRLYTNRSILNAIPKTFVPVEEGDVDRSVRKIIADSLAESAVIAYEAKPRTSTIQALRESYSSENRDCETSVPPWGIIAHPGWSSPASPDLPNLHYEIVIAELPDLIEAKAVSLAPTFLEGDLMSGPLLAYNYEDVNAPMVPDERVVNALQRPDAMGLRDYLARLREMNLINPPDLENAFLEIYERARFSQNELEEATFRSLMGVFAEILRGMSHIDAKLIAMLQRENDSSPDGSSEEGEVDSASHLAASSQSSSQIARSVSASESEGSLRTAPTFHAKSSIGYATPRSRPTTTPRIPSTNSLHRLRSRNSNVSRSTGHSGGSVIRLAEAHGPLDLPYVLDLSPQSSRH